MLSAVQNGPGNAAGVLSLQEERLGFAVLESEDLAVATDEELTLQSQKCQSSLIHGFPSRRRAVRRLNPRQNARHPSAPLEPPESSPAERQKI